MGSIFFAMLAVAYALDNGLLKTPPMGMNTWTSVGTAVTEAFLKNSAQFFVDSGMRDVGYQYVCSDDGWDTKRNETGYLQADPLKFPSGIPSLANFIHSLDLKLGLYGASSSVVCSGRPGSLYLEDRDARTYASWGVDYIKQDNCGEYALGIARFQAFADAINRTGRSIAISTEPFSIIINPLHAPFANLWRTGNDISANYATIVNRIDLNDKWAVFTGPGAWADPDMIQCGNGGLTEAECRTNFGLWAVTKSPLILGTNVAHLSSNLLKIILNKGVISVNQDSLGIQATKRSANGNISPKFVGLAPCATSSTTPGVNGVKSASLQWKLRPISDSNNTYTIYHPDTNRCLATRPYINRPMPVPVLLPCDSKDTTQVWILPRPLTIGGIINQDLNLTISAGDSTVYGAIHGSDSMPLLDQAYGLTNLTFAPYKPEPYCDDRNCDNYVPQQSFYYSPVTGKISLGLMASNIYRCFEGSCYVLTGHYPAIVDLCLSHVASISNDGVDTNIGGVHVWAGPLEGGNYVFAMDNRANSATNGTLSYSLLEAPGIGDSTSMCLRELFSDTELGVHVGGITLPVPSHDTLVIKAFPAVTSC